MFEKLFTCPSALRRHQNGPLAAEREAYLRGLSDQGMARATILGRSSYCLCVAIELQKWPPDRCFDEDELEELATAWAAGRRASGRASSSRWPKEHFWQTAKGFLQTMSRLRAARVSEAGRYSAKLADFIAAQQKGRWQSAKTCQMARWQITQFLDYLEQRGVALEDVEPADVDAFFQRMADRWGRNSLRISAKMLRAWFGYCETRGWAQPSLSDAILLPRIYRHEELPLGPTWDVVGQMLKETNGDDPASTRDHAILLLLSVYGLRSGELRRLCLDDIDWATDRIRFSRSKSGLKETAPIEPTVGNAIARYLRDGRPKTESSFVFLSLRAPHRPLSASGLYDVVNRHLTKVATPQKGRGPHGLRHACARHLIESGRSFKEVGDHLGHRNPDATRIYAKVNLAALRQVAFDDLGGLS